MSDDARLVRRWRHPRLRSAATHGEAPAPIEVLADRLNEAARARGGPRRLVWLDPGGPTATEAEGVLTAFPLEVVRPEATDPNRLVSLLDDLAPAAGRATSAAIDARFRGGWLGFFSYECVGHLEPVRLAAPRDMQVPLASWARHPVWFRHLPQEGVLELWTTVSGDADTATGGAVPSLAAWVHWAEEALRAPFDNTTPMLVFPRHLVHDARRLDASPETLAARAERSFTRDAFEGAVRMVQEAIHEGEVFQANLAHRLRVRTRVDPFHVHLRLRRLNPSPYAAYLEEDWGALVSNSPERLFTIRDDGRSRLAETRPIAGTRPRLVETDADAHQVAALRTSEKERAEHTMLVDLARNDLGRIAQPGTVVVDAFQVVEAYSHLHHLVSNVRGVVPHDLPVSAAVRAFFPGGTITGAPKLRSIEVIDRVEPVARGPYTGSLGRIELDGTMDLNILIRTLIFTQGTAMVYAGAGIVADSDPASEYDETLHKAAAMLRALAEVDAAGSVRPSALPQAEASH